MAVEKIDFNFLNILHQTSIDLRSLKPAKLEFPTVKSNIYKVQMCYFLDPTSSFEFSRNAQRSNVGILVLL